MIVPGIVASAAFGDGDSSNLSLVYDYNKNGQYNEPRGVCYAGSQASTPQRNVVVTSLDKQLDVINITNGNVLQNQTVSGNNPRGLSEWNQTYDVFYLSDTNTVRETNAGTSHTLNWSVNTGAMSKNGNYYFAWTAGNAGVYRWPLGTQYIISTINNAAWISSSVPGGLNVYDIDFSSDGLIMIVCHVDAGNVYLSEFSLSTAYLPGSGTLTNTTLIHSAGFGYCSLSIDNSVVAIFSEDFGGNIKLREYSRN